MQTIDIYEIVRGKSPVCNFTGDIDDWNFQCLTHIEDGRTIREIIFLICFSISLNVSVCGGFRTLIGDGRVRSDQHHWRTFPGQVVMHFCKVALKLRDAGSRFRPIAADVGVVNSEFHQDDAGEQIANLAVDFFEADDGCRSVQPSVIYGKGAWLPLFEAQSKPRRPFLKFGKARAEG